MSLLRQRACWSCESKKPDLFQDRQKGNLERHFITDFLGNSSLDVRVRGPFHRYSLCF